MESIAKFFNLLKEMWYAPFTIYLIGFFYVQGAFSPYLSEKVIFESIVYVTPVSYTLYITNGIKFTCILIIPLIIAHLVSYGTNKYVLKGKKIDGLALLVITTIIMFFTGFLQFSTIDFNSSFSFFKFNFVYIFIYLTIGFLFIKLIKTGNKTMKLYCTLYFSLLLVSMLILSVYLSGLLAQNEIVNKYIHKKGNIQLMQVTEEDGQQISLLRFDINNDYIIGYDLNVNKMKLIPKNKVKKLETSNYTIPDEKYKFDPDHPAHAGDNSVIQPVNNYYSYLIDNEINNQDTRDFLSILTTEFKFKYFNGIGDVSSEILTKRMNNENYRGKEAKDFYGVVSSVPETQKPKKKDASNVYYKKVYVREFWKNQSFDVLFTLKSSDGQHWLIDNIDETSFNFVQ
ncbi:hypothetical protein [Paenibacillus glycanilyticus]|uniref:hypothetical protein n=1 Tax=Paenibacillus glycanilyticus TaxID=126569 RepID=UPI001911109D|nr:hypothetical protein [Paenibacillus glycanilyticus]